VVTLAQNPRESVKSGKIRGKGMWDGERWGRGKGCPAVLQAVLALCTLTLCPAWERDTEPETFL
jgi:hypothetical protein